jgi:hypothetical protein
MMMLSIGLMSGRWPVEKIIAKPLSEHDEEDVVSIRHSGIRNKFLTKVSIL